MATPPADVVEETTTQSAPKMPLRRPAWALAVVVIAVIAIAAALVVGVTGLFANPVRSMNPDGTTTLQGTFEPYQCDAKPCTGYVQAGARSVFVQFPASCAPVARGSQITITARPAPDLGKGAYRATGCA